MSLRARLRATDYYTNLDEGSPAPSKKYQRIQQLNAVLEKEGRRIGAALGFTNPINKTQDDSVAETPSTPTDAKNGTHAKPFFTLFDDENDDHESSPYLTRRHKKSAYDVASATAAVSLLPKVKRSTVTSASVEAAARNTSINGGHSCGDEVINAAGNKKSRKSSGDSNSSAIYSDLNGNNRKSSSSSNDNHSSPHRVDSEVTVRRRHREQSSGNNRHSTERHSGGGGGTAGSTSHTSSQSRIKVSASSINLGGEHRRTLSNNISNSSPDLKRSCNSSSDVKHSSFSSNDIKNSSSSCNNIKHSTNPSSDGKNLSNSSNDIKLSCNASTDAESPLIHLHNGRLPKSTSHQQLNSVRDSSRTQISKSHVNLRYHNDNNSSGKHHRRGCSEGGPDPYGGDYKHIRWQDFKDIIYEYDLDDNTNGASHGKHVSRNKSFHSSRTTAAGYQSNNNNVPVISDNNINNKLRCQSVDNVSNMKNGVLYINHIHREVVSSFINKNNINHVNSNLFTSAAQGSHKHRRDRSLSKSREHSAKTSSKSNERTSSTPALRSRPHSSSTSDYASHSDSSSSSQSSTYSSGCYSGGYCSPVSSAPSSPASSVGTLSSRQPASGCSSFPNSPTAYMHASSCPVLRSPTLASPDSPDFTLAFHGHSMPKLLHISNTKDRWVIRRPDGLVVEIIPEHLWIKEQKKRSWKKALLDLFRDR